VIGADEMHNEMDDDNMGDDNKIDQLLKIMVRLRDKKTGCPWDIEQTLSSIVPHTIEEAYEVADAIDRNSMDDLKDELGDLLFQVIFYSQIASEQKLFEFNDVVDSIITKLINRHPHVFADTKIDSAEEQNKLWEKIKRQERQIKAENANDLKMPSALDNIPKTMPALTRAYKLHKKAAMVGFDWDSIDGVMDKLNEEIDEVQFEINNGQIPERMQDEIGDLLFVTTILARHAGIDPETTLRHANNKFERRFKGVEALLAERNVNISDAGLEELDAMWDIVKSREKK